MWKCFFSTVYTLLQDQMSTFVVLSWHHLMLPHTVHTEPVFITLTCLTRSLSAGWWGTGKSWNQPTDRLWRGQRDWTDSPHHHPQLRRLVWLQLVRKGEWGETHYYYTNVVFQILLFFSLVMWCNEYLRSPPEISCYNAVHPLHFHLSTRGFLSFKLLVGIFFFYVNH